MEIFIPRNIMEIIEKLEAGGFEAYIVGGCVRDSILGNTPKDYDITTSAKPEEIKDCLSGYTVIDTGIKHGTVTALSEGENVEITTFRVDGKYSDHRRPDEVNFSESLSDDLSRRDFTVNAMAYNPKTGLIDIFGGQNDLFRRKLSCVGDPEKRFDEDALRIMRALRFSSELGFEIDEAASAAILNMKDLLKEVAAERISKELVLLLNGKYPHKVLSAYHEVLEVLIPEITPCVGFEQHSRYHAYDVWEHMAYAVEFSKAVPEVRLALFLHDIGKPRCFTLDENGRGHFKGHENISAEMASHILKRLKFPSKTIALTEKLIKFHYVTPVNDDKVVRKLLSKVGKEDFFLLMEVMKGDNRAKCSFCFERVRAIEDMQKRAVKLIDADDCLKVTDLAVSGREVMERGFEGAEIRAVLEALLEDVINEKLENKREILIQKIEKLAEEKISRKNFT